MEPLDHDQLQSVCGGESFADVRRAMGSALDVPLDQQYAATQSFIAEHPFFHQGLMNMPIGGGKHFRNVPFVGPSRMIKGALHGDADGVRRGWQITRGTWQAP